MKIGKLSSKKKARLLKPLPELALEFQQTLQKCLYTAVEPLSFTSC